MIPGCPNKSIVPRKAYAAARKSPTFDAAAVGASIEKSSVMSRNLRRLRARDLNLPVAPKPWSWLRRFSRIYAADWNDRLKGYQMGNHRRMCDALSNLSSNLPY